MLDSEFWLLMPKSIAALPKPWQDYPSPGISRRTHEDIHAQRR